MIASMVSERRFKEWALFAVHWLWILASRRHSSSRTPVPRSALAATLFKRHRSIPGHAIAVVKALYFWHDFGSLKVRIKDWASLRAACQPQLEERGLISTPKTMPAGPAAQQEQLCALVGRGGLLCVRLDGAGDHAGASTVRASTAPVPAPSAPAPAPVPAPSSTVRASTSASTFLPVCRQSLCVTPQTPLPQGVLEIQLLVSHYSHESAAGTPRTATTHATLFSRPRPAP